MTFGNAKKSGSPKKAPKVSAANPKKNFMKESDKLNQRKNTQTPLTKKRLSK